MADGCKPRELLSQPRHWIALGFGAGLSPWAPGTAGTLLGVLLYYLVRDVSWPLYVALVAAAFLVGIALCGRTARALGTHDHPAIVWDEVVGYLATMLAGPASGPWPVVGFVLFRLFDIVKPWPISYLDRRVPGGFGIMADDLMAALFASAMLRIIYYISGIYLNY